jgi:hypothetical protein
MKNLKTLILGASVLFFASCTITRPYAVTNNAIGDAVGTSKTTLIFGSSAGTQLQQALFSTNKNFGVIEAAKNGNVDKIATVDVQTSNFGLFSTVRIIVTGTESSSN